MSAETSKKSRIGIALAGGGPQGAVYEIGALRALDEAIEGVKFTEVDTLVGVSAGAFVSSCLANGMSTAKLVRMIVKTDPGEHPFNPELFLTPAMDEYWRSLQSLPRWTWKALVDYIGNHEDRSIFKSITKLSRAIPVGLFNSEPLRIYLEKSFGKPGRTNDFRKLKPKLYVVAADLDSGESAVFGTKGMDHVPISKAVQASTALPGLYPPVDIDGRHFVDGVLLKTLHTSTVLDEGMDLTICLNPIVPVDTAESVDQGFMRRGKLIDRGMPTVLSQTFRTLIHSRRVIGFERYETIYADSDLLLFEPSRQDYNMFFTNIFSFSSRKKVAEHAYRNTLEDISRRRDELSPILEKHGLRLNTRVIDNPKRDLWLNAGLYKSRQKRRPLKELDKALALLEEKLV
ncbi:MAG: patatin-like phospholipase family protein [Acidobacteriota bacterium]|nr:patatin-like phospholipase family protein [Acidobacteriota bacterium]